MPSWTLTSPPNWNANPSSQSDYVATPGGWEDSTTGELVVAIPNLLVRSGGSHLESVALVNPASYYKLGSTIAFNVTYNQDVTVTGTPTMTVTAGGVAMTTTYYSAGSSANVLQFHHTVGTGDNGVLAVTSPLVLSGGTIKDAAGSNPSSPLTFTPPTTTSVQVRGLAPAVSSAAMVAGPTYVTGNSISVTLTFNETVFVSTVSGIPTVAYTIGSGSGSAAYASGTGTAALTFTYVAQAGDHAVATGFTVAGAVVLNGGTIKDAAGNSISPLTYTAPTTTTVTVN